MTGLCHREAKGRGDPDVSKRLVIASVARRSSGLKNAFGQRHCLIKALDCFALLAMTVVAAPGVGFAGLPRRLCLLAMTVVAAPVCWIGWIAASALPPRNDAALSSLLIP